MNLSRNDYTAVCVYCHTPHAGNKQTKLQGAPLWNRTLPDTGNYKTYDKIGTSSDTAVTSPGANSLTCLSCHDGTIAIDSIINMPGSGSIDASQETEQNDAFLWSWKGDGPGQNPFYGGHGTLNPGDVNQYGACMACHSPSGDQFDPNNIPNFDAFYLGTDLTDDHPVGVGLPETGPVSADFVQPNVKVSGKIAFYDGDGDGHADSNEIRFYDTGDGFEVECASCHDPHGVSPGDNAEFNPTFLRVANTGSGVCMTCHSK